MQKCDNIWVGIFFIHIKILKNFDDRENENYRKCRDPYSRIIQWYIFIIPKLYNWWYWERLDVIISKEEKRLNL
jgi:hypothetical protein